MPDETKGCERGVTDVAEAGVLLLAGVIAFLGESLLYIMEDQPGAGAASVIIFAANSDMCFLVSEYTCGAGAAVVFTGVMDSRLLYVGDVRMGENTVLGMLDTDALAVWLNCDK